MIQLHIKGYEIRPHYSVGQKVYFAGHEHLVEIIQIHPEQDDKFRYVLKDVLSPIPERMLSAMHPEEIKERRGRD